MSKIKISLTFLIISACGHEFHSGSKLGGVRGKNHNTITIVMRTEAGTEHERFQHQLMVCRPAKSYEESNFDQLCRNVLMDEDASPKIFDRVPYPSAPAELSGYAKALVFLVSISAMVFVSSRYLPFVDRFLKTVQKVQQKGEEIFTDVTTPSVSAPGIPLVVKQGIFGVAILSFSSALTTALLEHIPGHNERDAVKLWDHLFAQFGSTSYTSFETTKDPQGVLKVVAEITHTKLDQSAIDFAYKPYADLATKGDAPR